MAGDRVGAPVLTDAPTAARRSPFRVALGVALAVGVVAVVDPESTHVPLCPFHAVTGWWCPLCGGLRAVFALTRGDLGAALRDNLLFVAAVPLLIAGWVDWVLRTRHGLPSRRLPRAAWVAAFAAAGLFTVVRNLPASGWLRP